MNFQESTRLFLLGFCFLIKKYSVEVYSVIRFFTRSTRLRFTRLLHFFSKVLGLDNFYSFSLKVTNEDLPRPTFGFFFGANNQFGF